MGLYDRDYARPAGHARRAGGGGGGGYGSKPGFNPALWSVTTWIIAINVVIFAIGALSPLLNQQFFAYGHFSTFAGFQRLEVWRLISFQFLHANLMHVGFNMFGMHIFGRLVEQHLGSKRYLAFYLVCGVFGGVMYLVLNLAGVMLVPKIGSLIPGLLFHDTKMPLIGASAGVFGVIMACAYISPKSVVRLLFPPVALTMKTFAYGYVIFSLVMLLGGSQNAGGEAAHIGGALAGFFFIRNAHLLRDFFDVFGNSNKPGGKKKAKRGPRKPSTSELDRILTKVRAEGLGSLSERERRTLRNATEEKRKE